jgi:uncharacterized protein
MNARQAGLRIVIALGLCLAVSAAAAPASMDVDKVPNPLATTGLWVGDNGGVLGPDYVALIQSVCETLKVKTDAEFAVITVDDLSGLPLENFTAKLFERFGVGVAGKENGLLLLFSRDDKKIRFEVGYGMEGVITDSIAGRLLDEQALPFFREGQYGRGLYAVAKAAAEAIGKANGTPLGLTDPAAWPAQITPPQPLAQEGAVAAGEKTKKADPVPSALVSGGAVVLFAFLGFLFVNRKVAQKRGRAAKLKAAQGGGVFALTWLGSIGGFAALAAVNKTILPFLVSLGAVPIASSVGLGKALKSLRRRLADYKEPCAKCGQPMDLLDEQADDAFLTSEEVAEEKAGGMDYEVWQCASCGASESFALKLGKASACPQCKRRTLVTTTTTLVAATRTSGGKVRIEADCQNPACDYLKVTERHTPRLPPPSSGSSGSSGRSSSGRSSFGGGRSGGGGASRGW